MVRDERRHRRRRKCGIVHVRRTILYRRIRLEATRRGLGPTASLRLRVWGPGSVVRGSGKTRMGVTMLSKSGTAASWRCVEAG